MRSMVEGAQGRTSNLSDHRDAVLRPFVTLRVPPPPLCG
jgi:hypothetical protein